MRAGRVATLVMLVILVSVAVLIGFGADWLAGRGVVAAGNTALITGVFGLLVGLILLPMGWSLDRAMASLERSIESAGASGGETGDDENAAGLPLEMTLYGTPKWLLPITRAFTIVADRFHQREQALKSQLRELEIRHRVSEAERRQVEAVLHALRDPVIVTDAFNEIVMVNEAAAEAFGFSVDEAIHKPVSAVVHDRRLCSLIADVRDSATFSDRRHVELEINADREQLRLDGGAALRVADLDAERRGTERRGTGTVYDVTLACIENHKREAGGVVTILRDLSRERELSQMKTDFVSKASHELRTPLSSIRAYVEMLVDGEANDESSRQQFYRVIHDETERLGRLIDNMLNISRIEAGIVQIERENVDMKVLINRAIHTFGPQAAEKDIALTAKLAAVDLCVEGDPDMLYQVLLNLISNAIKYIPHAGGGGASSGGEVGSGARITVSADSDNLTRSVVVTVADTGLGIPPDAIPKVFDKFYRVENYKRVAKGTGLGLSLCKHIVQTVHHGQIGVESKLGMGSRFWFSIPMKYAGSQAAA